MRKSGLKNLKRLSFGEEVGNAVTHLVMAVLTLIALPICAVYAYEIDGTLRSIGVSVFLISLFLMFLGSALYHTMPFDTSHKFVTRICDHIFIYVAIAAENSWLYDLYEEGKHLFHTPDPKRKEVTIELARQLHILLKEGLFFNHSLFTRLFPEWETILEPRKARPIHSMI